MSASEGSGWVAVVGWNEYLHYSDRAPVWIKLPLRLAGNDDFRELTAAERGVFVGVLWEYGRTSTALRWDHRRLTARLGCRVTEAQLRRLVQAGLLVNVASRELAARYHDATPRAQPREEKRRDRPKDVREGKSERPQAEKTNGLARLDAVLPAISAADAEAEQLERARARIGRIIP